jgi:hypothetical protein
MSVKNPIYGAVMLGMLASAAGCSTQIPTSGAASPDKATQVQTDRAKVGVVPSERKVQQYYNPYYYPYTYPYYYPYYGGYTYPYYGYGRTFRRTTFRRGTVRRGTIRRRSGRRR